MTNLEHLMENALAAQQRMLFNQVKGMSVREAYAKIENEFKKSPGNIDMAKMEEIQLNQVWEMAKYVTEVWNDFAMYRGYV